MTRRTGAAATRSADHIAIHRLSIVLLCLAVAGGLTGSVEGLLHAGSWAEPVWLQWSLPVSVDVFLVGTALVTLALRERRAYWAAGLCAIVTLALVSFSAVTNWVYVYSTTQPGTVAHAYGPWIKGSMPVLLLLALEIIAALVSTRNNKANSPLNRARRDLSKVRAELRAERKRKAPATVVASKAPEPVTDLALFGAAGYNV